jgi:DNA-binding transcriptional MerR regulator
MNWTSQYAPIEGVKYIVETEGCVFPAHIIDGTWWNTERGFPIDGVKRWIVYPEGEEPNDLVAPEMLLKYAYRECRALKEIAKEESEKVKQLRKLNKELTEQFNKLHQKHMNLQTDIQNRCSATEEVEVLRLQNKNLTIELANVKRRCSILADDKERDIERGVRKDETVKILLKENARLKRFLKCVAKVCEVLKEQEEVEEPLPMED